jgi:ABC-type bacteriocin/lantibiotic exporter with double-glycine peptidase domain
MNQMARVPFLFLIAFGAFFYYYKWTFLSGLVVVLLAIICQSLTGIWLSKIQKKLMETKDARMKVTTEALNHPKMLKLYSWQNNFVRRIIRKRAAEMIQLRRQGWGVAYLVSCIYFWPNLLPVVVFSTYIYFGNNLTLDIAIGSLILFNQMRSPLIELPWFIKMFLEMLVSNRRIQKFMLNDEV